MPNISDITDPAAVLRAITEYDRLGQEEFLEEYGYGPATRYFLRHDGKYYDSKAILGVAYGYQFPSAGPLFPTDFSGGEATVQRVLHALGFTVVRAEDRSELPLGTSRNERHGPTVTFKSLVLGELYGRKELASLWGYRDWHAIGRGCVTPANHKCLILFITHQKQEALTQYADYFEGDILHIEGETNHASDLRIVNATANGDEIHLFYRDTHHTAFTYFGEVELVEHELRVESPSKFAFQTGRAEALAESAIATEDRAHGNGELDPEGLDATDPDGEGERRRTMGTRYERSAKNRALAIKHHGTRCKVCEFDFNVFYGADFARDFIHIHHTRSITELDGTAPDIEKDLVPLCANCHSMAHRERSRIVPVEELKARIAKARG